MSRIGISYYRNSYSDKILVLSELEGLSIVLEDMENDLSDAVYQSLETAIKAWNFPGIADAVLNEHSYPISFNDQYTALICQLF